MRTSRKHPNDKRRTESMAQRQGGLNMIHHLTKEEVEAIFNDEESVNEIIQALGLLYGDDIEED